MDSDKPTLGETAINLLDKSPEPVDVREVERAMEKEFFKELEKTIEDHRNYADNYFIQILMLQENLHRKWFPNVFTRKIICRRSEPLPDYDTTLYSYNNKKDQLYFHWTVPTAEVCFALNANESELDKDSLDLLNHIKRFAPEKITNLDPFKKQFKEISLNVS